MTEVHIQVMFLSAHVLWLQLEVEGVETILVIMLVVVVVEEFTDNLLSLDIQQRRENIMQEQLKHHQHHLLVQIQRDISDMRTKKNLTTAMVEVVAGAIGEELEDGEMEVLEGLHISLDIKAVLP